VLTEIDGYVCVCCMLGDGPPSSKKARHENRQPGLPVAAAAATGASTAPVASQGAARERSTWKAMSDLDDDVELGSPLTAPLPARKRLRHGVHSMSSSEHEAAAVHPSAATLFATPAASGAPAASRLFSFDHAAPDGTIALLGHRQSKTVQENDGYDSSGDEAVDSIAAIDAMELGAQELKEFHEWLMEKSGGGLKRSRLFTDPLKIGRVFTKEDWMKMHQYTRNEQLQKQDVLAPRYEEMLAQRHGMHTPTVEQKRAILAAAEFYLMELRHRKRSLLKGKCIALVNDDLSKIHHRPYGLSAALKVVRSGVPGQ
jgi:hypothetical protein